MRKSNTSPPTSEDSFVHVSSPPNNNRKQPSMQAPPKIFSPEDLVWENVSESIWPSHWQSGSAETVGASVGSVRVALLNHVLFRIANQTHAPGGPPNSVLQGYASELQSPSPFRFVERSLPPPPNPKTLADGDCSLLPFFVVEAVLSRYCVFSSPEELYQWQESLSRLKSPSIDVADVPKAKIVYLIPLFFLSCVFFASVLFIVYVFLLITNHDASSGDESEFAKAYIKFINDALAFFLRKGGDAGGDGEEGQCQTSW
ncbi:hypothetical protein TrLO_g8258 [Triparma laevis f. longispina]|uniref:Uncharacterized protein n=1 Tax=Triparma laevis f. longispina TaxID=1714387 RepID=A0A9W7CF52_9STRA|nr:hypothetical protein TrLO_g8258 [Triparma laevis f. longispina]